MLEAVSCTGGETAQKDDKWLFHPSWGTEGTWAWGDGGSGPSAPGNGWSAGGCSAPVQIDVPSSVKGVSGRQGAAVGVLVLAVN